MNTSLWVPSGLLLAFRVQKVGMSLVASSSDEKHGTTVMYQDHSNNRVRHRGEKPMSDDDMS